MDGPSVITLGISIGAMLVALAGALGFYALALAKPEQGHALVVSKPGGEEVRLHGGVVLPILHRAEVIDLRTKTLVIDRRAAQGVSCRDGIRADVTLTAYVRVSPTAEDVLKVARSLGCARAGDPAVLEELLAGKLSEALKTVAAGLDFEHLHRDRQAVKDEVIAVVGRDLSGFVLDDVVIDRLEQTPLEQLDPSNVLDAQGIRRITERTSQEKLRTQELELEAERRLRMQQLELEELVIELERRKADALGRFREATGRELTDEALRTRLEEGLRKAVERVLDERQRRAPPER